MLKLKVLFYTVVFTLALVSCAPSEKSILTENKVDKADTVLFGWFDHGCFATLKKNLSQGTKIFVVTLDDPQLISSAKVIGPANPQNCGPLAADRRQQNESEGLSFYEIKSADTFGLAIGVIGEVSHAKVKNGVVRAELGNDGTFERFTLCATSEGLSFGVWALKPYEGKAIWSGYYYLGYDVERTCP